MDIEARKQAVREFLHSAAAGRPRQAARLLAVGGVHHNVHVPAGWDALLAAMEEAGRQAPQRRLEVLHVLCDGDLAAAHSRVLHRPGAPEAAVVHLFRFEGGQIAEMWDVGQEVPADSPNADGAF